MKDYFRCKCGSDEFIRVYSVWNEKIKVKVADKDGDYMLDVEEQGKEKDSLYGYICAKCRKDADKLNEEL